MFFCNYTPNFFQQDLHRKSYIFGGGIDSKKIRNLGNMGSIGFQNSCFSKPIGLISSFIVWIQSFAFVKEYSVELYGFVSMQRNPDGPEVAEIAISFGMPKFSY